MMQKINSINVGIIMYPDVQQAAVLGLMDLFSTANQMALREHAREDSLCQIYPVKIDQPILNLDLPTFIAKGSNLDFSALIVPPCGGDLPIQDVHKLFIHNLQHYYEQGSLITSIGNGIFLLAEAGIIDRKTVSLHWRHQPEFMKRFPHIEVDVNPLILMDSNVITAAGVMTWIDLGLQLIKHFMGRVIMGKMANYLLLQPAGREQSYFSVFTPNFSHGDKDILKGQRWIKQQSNLDITLHQLSEVTGLEIRTLQRRFVKATRMTITEYIQRYRIHKAQELLQFTELTVDEVSSESGYKDANTFRKVFIKITGLSPNHYRKNFAI